MPIPEHLANRDLDVASVLPASPLPDRARVVIVGGGIVGCMTALELLRRDCEVTLVDRNVVASQTSGESSWAGAGILFPLLPWMYADEVNRLTMTGAAIYPAFCQELLAETGIDPEYRRCGMLLLPQFDSNRAATWCDAFGIEAQAVPVSSFPELRANGAGRTGLGFDDDRLLEQWFEHGGERSPDGVNGATGRKWIDQRDRPGRIGVLSKGWAGGEGRCDGRRADHKFTSVHCILPGKCGACSAVQAPASMTDRFSC